MALSVRGIAQVFSTTSTTVVTIPVATQAGDMLILQAVGGWTPTVPAGWNAEYSKAGTNIGSFVASKVAGAGDAGATITVSWSNAYNNIVNLIVIAGGYGIRPAQGHLWASSGGTGTPGPVSGIAGDIVVYIGGNRSDGGAPTLSRGTVDVTAADSSTIAAGAIGHEILTADESGISCTFTAPTSGNGYEYSVLVIASAPIPTNTQLSRLSAEALIVDASTTVSVSRVSTETLVNDAQVARGLSRLSLEILIPSEPRFRGWAGPL